MKSNNARIGLVLFVIYTLIYGGFVFLNAFAPQFMEQTPIGGLNLAIIYGMVLIFAAFFFALLYGYLCRSKSSETSSKKQS